MSIRQFVAMGMQFCRGLEMHHGIEEKYVCFFVALRDEGIVPLWLQYRLPAHLTKGRKVSISTVAIVLVTASRHQTPPADPNADTSSRFWQRNNQRSRKSSSC